MSDRIKAATAEIIGDPAKLAAWAKAQDEWRAGHEAYMAKEVHGDCYCARCMATFDALCAASPKAAEIRRIRQERGNG